MGRGRGTVSSFYKTANSVVCFQFPKIFKQPVSAPTGSYSKIDMTVRRGLKRRIINRCYYKDLKTRGPHLDHLKVFLEIAHKPPSRVGG